MQPVKWLGSKALEVEGVRLHLALPSEKDHVRPGDETGDETWVVYRDRGHVENYFRLLANEDIRNVVELGVWSGGSLVLWQKLWQLEKIVGIDIAAPNASFLERVAGLGLSDRIRVHYETDQSDTPAVSAILKSEFPERNLDLIIDDASHELVPTTKALLTAFPYLRPGGWYAIEDWTWELSDEFDERMKRKGLLRLVDSIVRIAGHGIDDPPIVDLRITNRLVAFRRNPQATSDLPLAHLIDLPT